MIKLNVIHIKSLKQALNQGLVLKKVHEVIKLIKSQIIILQSFSQKTYYK